MTSVRCRDGLWPVLRMGGEGTAAMLVLVTAAVLPLTAVMVAAVKQRR